MMEQRMHVAIAVGTMGNLHTTLKFLYLHAGRILQYRQYTDLPMPNRIIRQVNTKQVRVREKDINGCCSGLQTGKEDLTLLLNQ